MKPRGRRVSEKTVEAAVDRLCALAGCEAVRFSQARATQQSPGIPDRLYYPPVPHRPFWVEVKAEGGRQSKAQVAFQSRCAAHDERYVLGGYRDVLRYLVDVGLWRLPAGVGASDVGTRLEDIGLALKDGTVSRPKGKS